MRYLVLAALILPATHAAADTAERPTRPEALEKLSPWRPDCKPTAAQQVARQVARGQPQLFHRLVELPPATGYAAVYRVTNGCEDPLTMIEYRRTVRSR